MPILSVQKVADWKLSSIYASFFRFWQDYNDLENARNWLAFMNVKHTRLCIRKIIVFIANKDNSYWFLTIPVDMRDFSASSVSAVWHNIRTRDASKQHVFAIKRQWKRASALNYWNMNGGEGAYTARKWQCSKLQKLYRKKCRGAPRTSTTLFLSTPFLNFVGYLTHAKNSRICCYV